MLFHWISNELIDNALFGFMAEFFETGDECPILGL